MVCYRVSLNLHPFPSISSPADLADSSSDKIFTPSDLIDGYFVYTTAVGAWVHSGGYLGLLLTYLAVRGFFAGYRMPFYNNLPCSSL